MSEWTSSTPVTGSVVTVWPAPIGGVVVIGCIASTGILGNILILITYLRSRPLRVPHNMFYINLAIADLGFVVFEAQALVNLVQFHGARGWGDTTCFVQGLGLGMNIAVSFYSIGLIAISRYIIIVHPAKKKYMMWWFCTVLCVGCWIAAILLVVPTFTQWARLSWQPRQYVCAIDWKYNMVYSVIVAVAGFGVVSVVMFYSYIRIYLVYRQSRKRVATIGKDTDKGLEKEFRLALQLFIVYAIYNMCWLPYFVVILFYDVHGQGPTWMYMVLLILGSCNSSVNIVIYLAYNKVFRSECEKLFCVKCPQATVADTRSDESTRSENI